MKDMENRYFNAKIPSNDNHDFEEELRCELIREYRLDKSVSFKYIRTRNKMRFAFAMCTIMCVALGAVLINPQYAVNIHNNAFRQNYSVCDQIESADTLVKVVEAEYFEIDEEDVPAKYIVEKYVSKELGAVTYIKDPNKIENLYKSL
eukprot:Anaeramoba_ignava/a5022_5.p2 GENE.a5022_5~~a5022_5.p2  ORF type:complete len:148 (+),score=13.87 a5022_5:592-1035(+)